MPYRSSLTAGLLLCGTMAIADSHSTDGEMTATAIGDLEVELTAENVDLEAAEKIFGKTCRACHGNKAQGVASYPKLSDKEPEAIAEKLQVYRSGERVGPNSVLMIQHAKKLSDEDIANLSVYVATAFD